MHSYKPACFDNAFCGSGYVQFVYTKPAPHFPAGTKTLDKISVKPRKFIVHMSFEPVHVNYLGEIVRNFYMHN